MNQENIALKEQMDAQRLLLVQKQLVQLSQMKPVKALESQLKKKFKKGTNGCEIETKLCSDTTIENKEENCQYLKTSSTDNKCYYDGENCAEANSCNSVQETKLSDDKKIQSLCSLFDSETQDCIPEGKKCKLQDKEESGTDADAKEKGPDDEKESGKEKESEVSDGKEKENQK